MHPILYDIEINLAKPVTKVEVSVDNNNTWLPAHGTTNWYLTVNLVENQNVIWAKATDCVGDVHIDKITINVDTTPPIGSILINDGAEMTSIRNVVLALNATDQYGIASMMISEDRQFSDSSWIPYTSNYHITLTSKEGIKTVYVKYRDTSRLESLISMDTIILDYNSPIGTIIINSGAKYTNIPDVVLELDAADDSPVKMRINNNPSFEGIDWTDFNKTVIWTLPSNDGDHIVYAQFMDIFSLKSTVVNDTIILDTKPPTGSITINGGARITNNRVVNLSLEYIDDNEVSGIMLSENSEFNDISWSPLTEHHDWPFSPQEGSRTIYLRIYDAAGNTATISSTITLDYTYPQSEIIDLPKTSIQTTIPICWSGKDMTSSIKSYDIQYRMDDSLWQDWLLNVTFEKSNFSGLVGHSYWFRVRATDIGGNIEPYSENGNGPIQIIKPIPIIKIENPDNTTIVSGIISITGSSSHLQENKTIDKILVKIDSGPWKNANGTSKWDFKWDTLGINNGIHRITAIAWEGNNCSSESSIVVTVKNKEATTTINTFSYSILGIIIALITIITFLRYRIR
jgi:hypothetical protein